MRLMFYADCDFKCDDFDRVVPLIAVMGKTVTVSAAFFELLVGGSNPQAPGRYHVIPILRVMGKTVTVSAAFFEPLVGGSNPQAPGRYHVIPILRVMDCTQPAEAWLQHKVMRHMLSA